uniref:Uncharacterized protein n=1 Tax=Arundo donax TaxID=35708 RepID=A0A0A9FQ75_ARUDO
MRTLQIETDKVKKLPPPAATGQQSPRDQQATARGSPTADAASFLDYLKPY